MSSAFVSARSRHPPPRLSKLPQLLCFRSIQLDDSRSQLDISRDLKRVFLQPDPPLELGLTGPKGRDLRSHAGHVNKVLRRPAVTWSRSAAPDDPWLPSRLHRQTEFHTWFAPELMMMMAAVMRMEVNRERVIPLPVSSEPSARRRAADTRDKVAAGGAAATR